LVDLGEIGGTCGNFTYRHFRRNIVLSSRPPELHYHIPYTIQHDMHLGQCYAASTMREPKGRSVKRARVPSPLLAVAILTLILAGDARLADAQFGPAEALERCKSIVDQTAWLRCYEDTTGSPAERANPDTPGLDSSGLGSSDLGGSDLGGSRLGSWRLVRTLNPRGGPDAVSIMQTPDPSRSDIDLAGLMLRCSDRGFEVLIVLLHPLSSRARPQVKLTPGGAAALAATVVSPGAALALPTEAAALVTGPWQSAPELALEVDENDKIIRGVVSLAGLAPALDLLRSNCPSH
jgi:hypothetical protein